VWESSGAAQIASALQRLAGESQLPIKPIWQAGDFEKLVADDWIAISPDGKSQTKADRAAEIKTADITSATLGDMKVRVFGDTAVVTGTDDEITLKDGKKSIDHYVWTDVFVKRNGKWLGVASQTTQIK